MTLTSLRYLTKAASAMSLASCLVLSCATAFGAETVRINGSGSALDMVKPMITAYRRLHPGVMIVMEKPLGSSGALKALLAGALDITVSSKPLKPEEEAQGARAREYGKTPLLFVTHRGVAVKGITTREAEDIYSGRVRNWKGGSQIRLILRPDGDIDTTILRGLSPGMDSAMTTASRQQGMTVAITDPEANEAVEKTPGALGASSLTSLLVNRPPLNPLSLNGVRGTVQTLANGTYPLAKDIRFVTTARTPAAALKFLEFVYSPQGRAIAEKSGVFVSVRGKGAR